MEFKRVSVIKPGNLHHIGSAEIVVDQLYAILSVYGVDLIQDKLKVLVDLIEQPNALSDTLSEYISVCSDRVRVTGSLNERVIFIFSDVERTRGTIYSLNCELSAVDPDLIELLELEGGSCLHSSEFRMSAASSRRVLHPSILLIGLYHPETFPLPRFHLGISDLAHAVRKKWIGRTTLLDMQLDVSMAEVKELIRVIRPDIVGISATFGQYNLLCDLLGFLKVYDGNCIKVVGGSLSAHLKDLLLNEHDVDFVAVGSGEAAIEGIAHHWLNDLPSIEIPDVAYRASGKIITTRRSSNRGIDDVLPELDLLSDTMKYHGVMQLESSRGCSYACSFCPRTHKGIWAGEHSSVFNGILPNISRVFDQFPTADRRIFLVDEEFVGYQPDAVGLERCKSLANSLLQYGFRFETSSRIDQVSRPWKDKPWHLERMKFWLDLKNSGLARCLFGVESGVDSILNRFNKKTTARQNVVALRLLSLLEIPIRCTYITFDPLMSESELTESISFLDRDDILIRRPQNIAASDFSELFDIAIDDKKASACISIAPFYTSVSYLAVSMEALLGSPYLKMVEAENLAGSINALMGKRESSYADSRIGKISYVAQRWVDRNFSLDYTLKSLQKRATAELAIQLNVARVELKKRSHLFIKSAMDTYLLHTLDADVMDPAVFLTDSFELAKPHIERSVYLCLRHLPEEDRRILTDQLTRWSNKSDWDLINGQCD